MSDTVHITYLFDPLCGWCYGAFGMLRQLAAHPDFSVALAPTGLFSGNGTRPVDAQFAAFAWSHDQRIANLTGERFTEDYRGKVLGQRGGMLDSGPATLALTAVALTTPSAELDALRLIQEARYILGLDVTDRLELADIFGMGGLAAAAARLAEPDEELLDANRKRVEAGRATRQAFRIDGVPALIVGEGQSRHVVPAGELFGGHDLVTRLSGAKTVSTGADH